jgi:hypothetical protein
MRSLVVSVGLVAGLAGPLFGQACIPPDNSNEAKVFGNFAVPLAFGPLAAPAAARPGWVQLMLEGTYIPTIDSATRMATICRPGKGPENTGLLAAFPRPRIAIGLPYGLLLEGSWVPPISLNGVTPNVGSVALGRGFGLGHGSMTAGLRIFAVFGLIKGPFTCDDEDLANPNSECFQGTRSEDHYHPNTYGAEGSLGWHLAEGKVHPYVGGGVNLLRPRFQVNFVNQFGDLDTTRVETNLTRGVVFGGVSWDAGSGFGVAGEIYAAPADAVTGRVGVTYSWR